MSVIEKSKEINNKFEHNKVQYNLDRQTAKISVLSSGNISKYEFLTAKDVLSEKDLLEKAITLKRCEYSKFFKSRLLLKNKLRLLIRKNTKEITLKNNNWNR